MVVFVPLVPFVQFDQLTGAVAFTISQVMFSSGSSSSSSVDEVHGAAVVVVLAVMFASDPLMYNSVLPFGHATCVTTVMLE